MNIYYKLPCYYFREYKKTNATDYAFKYVTDLSDAVFDDITGNTILGIAAVDDFI